MQGKSCQKADEQRAEHGGDGSRDVNSVIHRTGLTVKVSNMPALTMRMYAIAMNVVIPATISVRTVVLFSFSLKNFFHDIPPLYFMRSISHNEIVAQIKKIFKQFRQIFW